MPLSATFHTVLITKRGMSQINRTSNRISALEVRNNLHLRFEGRKGGLKFRRRSRRWNARKRQQVGHITPLLFQGDMKKSVVTRARVTATSKGAKVISTTGARGFRSGQWREQVRKEIEQIPEAEEKRIARNKEKTIGLLVQQPKFQTRRVRKTRG